jgi:hypothetical protein
LKFAVLLMRSAYEAVDALDFIPMDKFQIKFWKLRQSEVEPYALQCQPLRVKYGDLTDPVCAFPHPLSLILCTRISIFLKTSINEKFGG